MKTVLALVPKSDAYDPLVRRIQKDVNGTVTRYVYDHEDLLLEYDGTNTLQARYTHGPGIDEPWSLARDTDANGSLETTAFYHADGLGSIVALTDAAGNVSRTYRYNAFGTLTGETGTLAQPYGFTGRELDRESGLLYYRARYYDPRLGRFLQEDPISLATVQIPLMRLRLLQIRPSLRGLQLNPLSGNPYSYVLNNPVNRIDPSGELSQVTVAILTILAILVAQGLELLISHLTQDVPLHVIKEKLKELAPEIREHRKELEEVLAELDAEIDRSSAGCPLPRDGNR